MLSHFCHLLLLHLQNKLIGFLILQVYTFGCNDEGALGRETTEEGSETVPGKVVLDQKVVQVSAGDSHTAALTEDGTVFIWGAFRVSHSSRHLHSAHQQGHLVF